MGPYAAMAFRVICVFLVSFLVVRLNGRKQISQLTYMDYVIGIGLGSMAGGLILSSQISLLLGLFSIAVWGLLLLISNYLALKNLTFRRFIHGEPLILIQHGKVLNQNMAGGFYNFNNLLAQLREKDIFDISEVDFAVLEPHGQLSVLKKPQHNPVTPKDLKIAVPYKGPMTELIVNGKLLYSHLKKVNKDAKWLLDQLKNQNVKDIADVLFAGLTSDGHLYVSVIRK